MYHEKEREGAIADQFIILLGTPLKIKGWLYLLCSTRNKDREAREVGICQGSAVMQTASQKLNPAAGSPGQRILI
jgi:hypothetical protein